MDKVYEITRKHDFLQAEVDEHVMLVAYKQDFENFIRELIEAIKSNNIE